MVAIASGCCLLCATNRQVSGRDAGISRENHRNSPAELCKVSQESSLSFSLSLILSSQDRGVGKRVGRYQVVVDRDVNEIDTDILETEWKIAKHAQKILLITQRR